MSKKISKIFYPQLRNDQFKFLLYQQGISMIQFSKFMKRQNNFANGVLTRQVNKQGLEFVIVPDYFVRELVNMIGEPNFWTSVMHWNSVHPDIPINISESESEG